MISYSQLAALWARKKYERVKKGEYKGEVVMLKLKKGGEFRHLKMKHFTADAVTGDISEKGSPITFYAKIVGFHDRGAPERDWGMTLKGFLRTYFHKKHL